MILCIEWNTRQMFFLHLCILNLQEYNSTGMPPFWSLMRAVNLEIVNDDKLKHTEKVMAAGTKDNNKLKRNDAVMDNESRKKQKEKHTTIVISPSLTKKFPCNHADEANFIQQIASNYYTLAYYKSNERAPRCCFDCKKTFGVDFNVGTKNPVFVCENALNMRHQCGTAYCFGCWKNVLINKNGGKRQSRSRKPKVSSRIV